MKVESKGVASVVFPYPRDKSAGFKLARMTILFVNLSLGTSLLASGFLLSQPWYGNWSWKDLIQNQSSEEQQNQRFFKLTCVKAFSERQNSNQPRLACFLFWSLSKRSSLQTFVFRTVHGFSRHFLCNSFWCVPRKFKMNKILGVALCSLRFIAIQGIYVRDDCERPFTSDQDITKSLIHLLSTHPEEYGNFLKELSVRTNRPTDLSDYKPMPFDDTCSQCAVSISVVKWAKKEKRPNFLRPESETKLPLSFALTEKDRWTFWFRWSNMLHVYNIWSPQDYQTTYCCLRYTELANFWQAESDKRTVLLANRQVIWSFESEMKGSDADLRPFIISSLSYHPGPEGLLWNDRQPSRVKPEKKLNRNESALSFTVWPRV